MKRKYISISPTELDKKGVKTTYAIILARADELGFTDEDWDEANRMADKLIYFTPKEQNED